MCPYMMIEKDQVKNTENGDVMSWFWYTLNVFELVQ